MVDTFNTLKHISRLTRLPEDGDEGRAELIRFLDSYGQSGPELPIVDSLCAHFGLYPYMSEIPRRDSVEALAIEVHTPPELAALRFTFHSEQRRIYDRLLDGGSVVLSAPTSFGKSAILEALVASNNWQKIVVIVPTIALIDETRRRLARYGQDYQIITSASQEDRGRAVYVVTQERFLELPPVEDVGLFIIDEFYKLDSGEVLDQRRSLLNQAWRELRRTGAQYYLTGPSVDTLSPNLPQEIKRNLVRTSFRTVDVDVFDRSDVAEPLSDLQDLLGTWLQESTLIFSASPDKANRLADELRGHVEAPGADAFTADVADWLGRAYDPAWGVVKALTSGIGVHSGPIPRPIQRMMVRLFNEHELAVLVCTSTLIEGVNTAAKNVVVFDHKVDGQLLDFFTFSNIRGRAGRMFRHFVGRVITYAPAPEQVATEVDIPIETQSSRASLATLAQLDWGDLEENARERIRHVHEQDDLGLQAIQSNRGLDPDRQIACAKRLRANTAELAAITWSGAAPSARLRQTLQVAFEELLLPRQRTGMNMNILWGKFQNVRSNAGNFSAMVDQQMTYARAGQTRDDVITEVLKFQRNWMAFTIPSLLRGVQAIQRDIAGQLGGPKANYEFVIREVEAGFLANGFTELEEYGLPLPLALKLGGMGLRGGNLTQLLTSIREMSHSRAVTSQLSKVELWLLKDVVDGLDGES